MGGFRQGSRGNAGEQGGGRWIRGSFRKYRGAWTLGEGERGPGSLGLLARAKGSVGILTKSGVQELGVGGLHLSRRGTGRGTHAGAVVQHRLGEVLLPRRVCACPRAAFPPDVCGTQTCHRQQLSPFPSLRSSPRSEYPRDRCVRSAAEEGRTVWGSCGQCCGELPCARGSPRFGWAVGVGLGHLHRHGRAVSPSASRTTPHQDAGGAVTPPPDHPFSSGVL